MMKLVPMALLLAAIGMVYYYTNFSNPAHSVPVIENVEYQTVKPGVQPTAKKPPQESAKDVPEIQTVTSSEVAAPTNAQSAPQPSVQVTEPTIVPSTPPRAPRTVYASGRSTSTSVVVGDQFVFGQTYCKGAVDWSTTTVTSITSNGVTFSYQYENRQSGESTATLSRGTHGGGLILKINSLTPPTAEISYTVIPVWIEC